MFEKGTKTYLRLKITLTPLKFIALDMYLLSFSNQMLKYIICKILAPPCRTPGLYSKVHVQ